MTANTIEDMVDELDEKNKDGSSLYAEIISYLPLIALCFMALLFIFLFFSMEDRVDSNEAQNNAEPIAHLIQQNEGKNFSVMDNAEPYSVLLSESSPVWDSNKDGILFVLVKDPKTNSDPQIHKVKVTKGRGLKIQAEGGPAWSVSIYKKGTQIANTMTHRYECRLDITRTSCKEGWYPTPLEELFAK